MIHKDNSIKLMAAMKYMELAILENIFMVDPRRSCNSRRGGCFAACPKQPRRCHEKIVRAASGYETHYQPFAK
jgi:hypothetical protein